MSNPFLDLPVVSQSSNPFMALEPANTEKNNENNISPIISGAAGFNKQYETLPANIASLGAKLIGAIDPQSAGAEDAVKKFYADRANAYQQDINQNPKAGLAGEIAGGIAESVPEYAVRAATLPLKAVQGGVAGYTGTDPNAPTSTRAINTLASAGLNMLPGGAALSTVAGGAAGAGYGYATGGDVAKDALIGAETGLSAYAGGKYGIKPLATVVKGIKPALTSPSDLADIATQKTLEQVGGDMSKATPEMFFKNVDNLTQAAKVRKNNDYNALYALADQEGVKVSKNNLASLVDNLQAQVDKGASSDTRTALKEAKGLLGKTQTEKAPAGNIVDESGNPLNLATTISKPTTSTYSEAYDLVKDIGKKINNLNNQGNDAVANKLKPIKDALLADIKEGGGSETLQQMKVDADTFYKNIYSPLKKVGTQRMFDPELAEKFSTDYYLSNALNHAIKNPKLQNAFNYANKEGLDNNAQNLLLAAHVNAVKNASTTEGLINPTAYGKALSQTMKDNPTPFAPVADKMRALGDALDVAEQYKNLRAGLSQHSLGQKIALAAMTAGAGGGFMTGGIPGAMVGASAYFLPKTKFLYAAGKMLKNPDTAALLDRAAKITEKTDKNVTNVIYKNIAKKFENQISTIPPRLLPIFDSSAMESPQIESTEQ